MHAATCHWVSLSAGWSGIHCLWTHLLCVWSVWPSSPLAVATPEAFVRLFNVKVALAAAWDREDGHQAVLSASPILYDVLHG